MYFFVFTTTCNTKKKTQKRHKQSQFHYVKVILIYFLCQFF